MVRVIQFHQVFSRSGQIRPVVCVTAPSIAGIPGSKVTQRSRKLLGADSDRMPRWWLVPRLV